MSTLNVFLTIWITACCYTLTHTDRQCSKQKWDECLPCLGVVFKLCLIEPVMCWVVRHRLLAVLVLTCDAVMPWSLERGMSTQRTGLPLPTSKQWRSQSTPVTRQNSLHTTHSQRDHLHAQWRDTVEEGELQTVDHTWLWRTIGAHREVFYMQSPLGPSEIWGQSLSGHWWPCPVETARVQQETLGHITTTGHSRHS